MVRGVLYNHIFFLKGLKGVYGMALHGYGKILDIDLSTGNIVKKDIDGKAIDP